MPRKLRLNLEYVRDWTLRRDVSIIIRTVGLLLRVIPNRAADEVKELRDRWFMEQSS
jgi:lipopolysaccharide/colanic/teichoic acid biosynthesis glycosyltransferase